MKKIKIENGKWIGSVSDGLTLPCKICGNYTNFDYKVTDNIWSVIVDSKIKTNVICLSCLDRIATEKKIDISEHIENIQFTGINKTIKLLPTIVYYYEKE